MDRGRMWERGGGYERVEVRRGEVREWTDVPLHLSPPPLSRLEVVGFGCNPWRWYRDEDREYI
jgi:hypothetical protein